MLILAVWKRFPTGRMTCEGAPVHAPGDSFHRDQSELLESAQRRRGAGGAAGTAGEWTSDEPLPGEVDAGVDRLCEAQGLAAPGAGVLRPQRTRRLVAPPDSSSLDEGGTSPCPASADRE